MNKKRTSISWQFLNYICSFAINFIIQIALARLIAPNDFGVLAILNTIIAFADIFVQSGISTALIQKKKLKSEDIFTSLIISVGVALTCCLLLFFGAPLIAKYYEMTNIIYPLRLMSLTLIFNAVNSVFSALLLRKMEYKKLFLRTVISLPIAGIIGIFLAYQHYGIWALVIYQLITVLINSIVYFITCEDKICLKFSKQSAKEIYSFGIKVLLTGLLNNIYDTVRTLIVGGRYSKADLAYYDRGCTYSKYTVQIANSMIQTVALPVFSRKQESIDAMKEDARRIVRFSAFIMFPLLIGVAALSKPLILLLLTAEWEKTIPYLTIFCFLRIPGVISIIDKQLFYAIGRSDIILKYSVISLLLNIATLYFVLPFGVLAVAINALVVEILVSILIMTIASSIVGYSIKEKILDIWKPLFASMLMFFVIVLYEKTVSINLVLQIILGTMIGIIIYVSMAILTRDKVLFDVVDIAKQKRKRI